MEFLNETSSSACYAHYIKRLKYCQNELFRVQFRLSMELSFHPEPFHHKILKKQAIRNKLKIIFHLET